MFPIHRLVFCTQTFEENQIQDSRGHAHAHHFGRHTLPTFRGRAILLIVTPLTTTPHPLFPLSLQLPSQNPFTAFHVSALLVNNNFPLSFGFHIGSVIGLRIVFPKYVL